MAIEPAYVLHARAWRESSLLLELFTAGQGRVGTVARGVRGARRQPLRAALQPFQPLSVDYVLRGELAQLRAAEPVAAAPVLAGERLLAGFYLNELLMRMLPRHDPAPALFQRYHEALGELSAGGSLAWALRRFERDLLELLGFAPPWRHDRHGQPLAPDRRYRLDAEHGPSPVTSGGVSGAALLDLVADRCPEAGGLGELRQALRALILAHLGGRPLHAWGLPARLPGRGVTPE